MIAGPVPQKDDLLTRIQFTQPAQVSDGAFAFAGWKLLEVKLLGQEIDRPIIGLSLSFIRHGYLTSRTSVASLISSSKLFV